MSLFERHVLPFFSTIKSGEIGEIMPGTLRMLEKEQTKIIGAYSKEEQQKIKSTITALTGIVDFIADDNRIKVFANHAGGGWYWNPVENYVRVDVNDILNNSIESNRFTIAHEAAHRRLTRPSTMPEKLRRNPAFHALFNVLEDNRINLWLRDKYKNPIVVNKGMRELYTGVKYDKLLDELTAKPSKQSYGALALNQLLAIWFQHCKGEQVRLHPKLPKPVKEFFDKAMPHLKKAWTLYPTPGSEGRGESVIAPKAQEFANVLVHKVWPLYQKLIEQSNSDKAKDSLTKKEHDKGKKNEKNKQGQQPQTGSGQSQGESEGESSEGSEGKDTKDTKDKKDKKDKDKKKGEKGKPQKADKKNGDLWDQLTDEEKKELDDAVGSEGGVDRDKLSDNTKKKIQDYFDSLSDSEKRELLDKARKETAQEQSEIADEHEGKLGTGGTEEKKDTSPQKPTYQKGGKPEARDKGEEDIPALAGESGGADEFKLRPDKVYTTHGHLAKRSFDDFVNKIERDGLFGAAWNEYQKFVSPVTTALKNKLDNVFKKRQQHGTKGGHTSGDDINVDDLIDHKAGTPPNAPPSGEPPVWDRKYKAEGGPRDYSFSILIDVSGSMTSNNAIHEAFKGLVIITEVLQQFGIELEIMAFNSLYHEVKAFDKPLDAAAKERASKTLVMPFDGRNGGTEMGHAISMSTKRLETRKPKKKTMLVITDGQPNRSDVPDAVRDAKARGIEVIGVGIGRGTDFVKTLFQPNGIANVPIQELARSLGIIIKQVIDNR